MGLTLVAGRISGSMEVKTNDRKSRVRECHRKVTQRALRANQVVTDRAA
jgi:hypothetical protein